ncbi:MULTISPECIES: hypothetical protein [unclassified Streptomyces]|uniref:hypothetical protein n=1 Tax=unclassified Streptomyces TaxID=2593676 RepID=UPI0022B6F0F8|nr:MULTISPECIES: hypothetical protein [unclassified Streptomyces]MCZ7416821.1 hypothetical protein [Streptomyces sp. WMMC897]MCZ7433369.1 hypothetical protein [Streptomyces sp. WMMC1477]
MADETGLGDRLADLAASGQRFAVPPDAERVRERGDRRRRRRRAALASGGVVLTAALAAGVLTLVPLGPGPAPAASEPTAPSTPRFVPPTPAPGEEYASEFGYVYDAVPVQGGTVRITVEQLHTGVVHTVTLSAETPVEVRQVAGGTPGDMRLGELVSRLSAGPQWVFAVDYDGEGRIRSLREAFWLKVE